MAIAFCSCTDDKKNTGQPSCVPQKGSIAFQIFVDYFDSTGAVNSILTTDTFDQTFLDNKINDTDTSKRWYPMPPISNIEYARADPTTFEIDTIPTIIEQGTKSFLGTFYHKGAVPKWKGVVDSFSCRTAGYFNVTLNGELEGMLAPDGSMYPIRIQDRTLFTTYIEPNPNTPQQEGVQLNYNVYRFEDDGNLIFIDPADITADLLNAKGLSDVIPALGAVNTTTEVELILSYCYGTFNKNIPLEGIVQADVSFFNVTDSLAVPLSSWVESPTTPGTYTATYNAAQTSADDMRFSLSKTGFEMDDFDYTIP